ncbi:MAG: glycosyltransferase family 4 protein [Paracoccaceae bacterium]|nr:glycosyltransferase family 4 protein [Paracoccaceae bacterium]
MNKNLTKLLQCYRAQCAEETPKPCWLGGKASLDRGINLYGFLLSETGLGESARLLYHALSTQDVKISACNRALKDRQNDTRFVDIVSDKSPFNVSLTVDGLTGFKRLRYQICKQKFNIAYPFWELDTIPAKYIDHLGKYERIWAPSGFIGDMLQRYGFSNVDVVKHPISLPVEEPDFFVRSGPLKILFHFDFDSFPARKNPEAAIHAFKSAFPGKEDVTLTVKARGKNDLGRRQWLAEQAAADPRIKVVDQLMTRQEVNDMTAAHDVFMSLHRSEGLGLGCAEALAAGKAVVATDYGGSTEFINEQTGYPVQWSRIDVGPDDYILAENSTWADPSVEHAATALRSIYADPEKAREKARKGFQNLVDNHSYEAVGRRMVNILQEHGLV